MRCDAMQCGLVFTCVDVFTHSRSLVKRLINHVTDQQDEDVTLCFSNITAPCLLVRAESCEWRSAAKTGARGWCFLNFSDFFFKTFILVFFIPVIKFASYFGGVGCGVVMLSIYLGSQNSEKKGEMDVSIAVISFVSPYPHTTAHYVIVCAWEHKNHKCTGRHCTILSV